MFDPVDRQLQMSQPEEKRPVDGAEVDAELPPTNSPLLAELPPPKMPPPPDAWPINVRTRLVSLSGQLLEMLHLALFVCEGQARVQTLKHWPLPFPFLPIFERLVPHVTKAIDEVNREYGRETLRLGILLIASVLVLNIKIWKEFCVRRFGIFGSFR